MSNTKLIQALIETPLTNQKNARAWYEACTRFLNDQSIDPVKRELSWHHLANKYTNEFLKHFNAFKVEDNALILTYPMFSSEADRVESERIKNQRIRIDLGDGEFLEVNEVDEDADALWNRENARAGQKLAQARSSAYEIQEASELDKEIVEIERVAGIDDNARFEAYLSQF